MTELFLKISPFFQLCTYSFFPDFILKSRSENRVRSLRRHQPVGRVNQLLPRKHTRDRQFVYERAQIRPRPLRPAFGRFMKANRPRLQGITGLQPVQCSAAEGDHPVCNQGSLSQPRIQFSTSGST